MELPNFMDLCNTKAVYTITKTRFAFYIEELYGVSFDFGSEEYYSNNIDMVVTEKALSGNDYKTLTAWKSHGSFDGFLATFILNEMCNMGRIPEGIYTIVF